MVPIVCDYRTNFYDEYKQLGYKLELLLNQITETDTELLLALSPDICYLEETETYEVIYYCLKGVDISNRSGCYDGIILSADLFNI